MSVISNISILQNPSSKKAFTKISFEVGEKFNARIVSSQKQNGEVNLKLLDGWQFSAKLDKPLEEAIDGNVLKFEVEGFEDGKLKIKLIFEEIDGKGLEKDILEEPSIGKTLGSDKADSIIFEKMIKHNMPLTKDNMIEIKSLIDFKEKISLNINKEDVFIDKYLSSRNIVPGSEKANETAIVLKEFFTALKSLNIDEILLFKENNIELTKGNLESFTKLFKGEAAVYNNLKDISNYILNNDEENLSLINKELMKLDIKQVDSSSKSTQGNIEVAKGILEIFTREMEGDAAIKDDLRSSNHPLNSDEESISFLNNKLVGSDVKQIDLASKKAQDVMQDVEKSENVTKKTTVGHEEVDSTTTKANGYGKNNSLHQIIDMIKKELNITQIDNEVIKSEGIDNETTKSEVINKGTINKVVVNSDGIEIKAETTDFLIKEQIKLKTDEIKNIIKDIIENKINLKPDTYEKVMSVFDQKINDIKVFNSISQQYYFLDLPINVNENEYNLKLIVKDDRKKSKKIDSKNVQIATSIKTINMGTVDAYIKINNNNMNIDINCTRFYVKILELSKEHLIKDLSSLSYNVNIKVNNKTSEFTLASCADFFEDRSFNTLNIKV